MKTKEQIAIEKFNKGEEPFVSTFIDEDSIIMGYGDLNYDFEYPLPDYIIISKYGTTSWSEFFNNKGVFQYEVINNQTLESSITHYMTEDEFLKAINLNNGFTFKKITK